MTTRWPLAISGASGSVAQAFIDQCAGAASDHLFKNGRQYFRHIGRGQGRDGFPWAERYLFAQGYLEQGSDLSVGNPLEHFRANCSDVIKRCGYAFSMNPKARIVVIGSMSGINGSFNPYYAAAKAGLHHYVKTGWKPPGGVLNCIAPTIISDSEMTKARYDYPDVLKTRQTVTCDTVARMIHFLLYADHGLNGTTIELAGARLNID